METMDMYGFYTGKILNAYEYLGAHVAENGTIFRVFAPNAVKVSIIGDFNNWNETPMRKIYDGNFYDCNIPEAQAGMLYKIRIYEKSGRFIDHCDPYGYGMELRPANASIIRDMKKYKFTDDAWLKSRTDGKDGAVNIYEVHLGSWKTNPEDENGWYTYSEIAPQLVEYVKSNGFNYIEIMPICEYPSDESWGYQAYGFYSPTSRYGSADDLKEFVNYCHKNKIGVILDFALVHFAVNDFGLGNFDGQPLYEYPNSDVGYNEWGSKNFAHSRGEVQSFLQSSIYYWLKEYHFDGVRMDAVSNIIYWQGNKERGENICAVNFIKYMNSKIKDLLPNVMLIAEDSTAYPNVTVPVSCGGLGFDYKWDMGWMNDTLDYFRSPVCDRVKDYHKLTFSMQYYYSEKFLLPFSHDEVVHGKATILQKMNGNYEEKFPQARALYMYMYAHPGKKLNFMGNEIGQLREWDEKREQDWDILKYPVHDSFNAFIKELNDLYMKHPSLYASDYDRSGFLWTDCTGKFECVYSFIRSGGGEKILAVFNFSDKAQEEYSVKIESCTNAELILCSNWECFGGNCKKVMKNYKAEKSVLTVDVESFSAYYFSVL